MSIKVSVIVPIYKHKIEYLMECLESLKNQTLQNIEIILIDNGATQESKDLIEKFITLDSRFRVIHFSENKGYSIAINEGINCARGEYIGIVESDDFCEPNMFEDFYNYSLELKPDILVCDFCYLTDSVNNKVTLYRYNKSNNPQVINLEKTPEIIYQPAYPWNKLYKKEFINSNNIRMLLDDKIYHDITWNAEILSKTNNILYVNEAYYYYRLDNNKSSTNIGDSSTINYILKKAMAREILIKNEKFSPEVIEYFWLSCYVGANGFYNRIQKKYRKQFYKERRKFFKFSRNDKCKLLYFNVEQIKEFNCFCKYSYIFWIFNKNKKNIIKNLFSVTNHVNNKHKVFTFLGMKFKFKKRIKKYNLSITDFQRLENKVDRLLDLNNCNLNVETLPKANGDCRLQQLSSLGILKRLVPFLKEHNINYWLEFGTLLGAVRHKGFIPWDDDIDIAMPIKDYLEFKKILPLFAINGFYYSDGDIIRISYKSSLAQVDVFPFYSGNKEFLPPPDETQKILNKISTLYKNMPVIWGNLSNFKQKSVLPTWYKNKIPQIYKEQILEGIEPPERAYMFLGYECFAYKRVLCSYDEIFPLREIEFEGEMFNCPNKTYMHLHNYWGDFYGLPNKICGHRYFKSPIKTEENYKDTMELIDG